MSFRSTGVKILGFVSICCL